ncbi:MAG: hypothetical protein JRD89_18350 [Deltaproteobacteria bacterium]|nr:hypothetical protein [Deltaproteobacteria bacterium]
MRILLAILIVLAFPTVLFPLGQHPTVPYSLSDLVCEEFMAEVWQIKTLQAYHGTGYRQEWINGRLHFYRDGQWCRYELPAGRIPRAGG